MNTRAGLSFIVVASLVFAPGLSWGETVRSSGVRVRATEIPQPASVSAKHTDEAELAKIGKVESPYHSCSSLMLVDSDSYKKNEAAWRKVRSESSQTTPLEIVPSTYITKSYDGTAAKKPGSLSPDDFLRQVGQTAVEDLKSGIEQYKDLLTCMKVKSSTKLCRMLEGGFRAAFAANLSPLNRALAQIPIVDQMHTSRAVVMNDTSIYLNPEGDLKKAGVFGTSSRKIQGEDLAEAKRSVRAAFDAAKGDFAKMIEAKIAAENLTGDVAERMRVQMTSPQATTAAIHYRMTEHRASKLAEYYRVLSRAPQLSYLSSAAADSTEVQSALEKMIADSEKQLVKSEKALREDPKVFMSYSGVIERVLASEAKANSGIPTHCGLATSLFNETIATKTGNELMIAGALLTAPVSIGLGGPRLAAILSGGRVAMTAAAAEGLALATGVSGGLLHNYGVYLRGEAAELAARTGVVKSEHAKDDVASGKSAGVSALVTAGIAGGVGRSIILKNAPKLPPTIYRSPGTELAHKVTDVARLKDASIVVRGSKSGALKDLPDGIFIYGMDKKGNTVLLPRLINPNGPIDEGSTYIGSHLGVQSVLREIGGSEPELAAMGEVIIRNGRTMAITNGAGTFKNGTENLQYGAQRLQAQGLKVDGRTELRDFSRNTYNTDLHYEANVQLKVEVQYVRDQQLVSQHKEAVDAVKRVDAMRVASKDDFFERALGMPDVDSTVAYHAATLYGRWQNPGYSSMYVFGAVREHIGPDDMAKVIQLMNRMGATAP